MADTYSRLPTRELYVENGSPYADEGEDVMSHEASTLTGSLRHRQISQELRVMNPCLSFVEGMWFQVLSVVVIMANTVMIVWELEKPEEVQAAGFFVADQVILSFYILELVLRLNYFGPHFFLGKFAPWNLLDIVVVLTGVLGQWVLPMLPIPTKKLTHALRLLQLIRAAKLARIFLEADLAWTKTTWFESFIGAIIAFNALLMGVETDIKWDGWAKMENALLIIYVFEIACRLRRFGINFFYNEDIAWNLLDFSIVVSSVIDQWTIPLMLLLQKELRTEDDPEPKSGGFGLGQAMMLMRMLRLMRILRLVRLVKTVRPLFNLVMGVLVAMQGVAWVLVLTVVSIYAMGILATRLVGHGMIFGEGRSDIPDEILKPFGTVPDSMFILFKIMNGAQSDSDATAIDTLMAKLPAMKFAFVFFMIASSWTLLSILTAVVSENMISTTSMQEEDFKLESAEKDRIELIEQLRKTFKSMDVNGDGICTEEELRDFISDEDQALFLARLIRSPARSVKEVLKMVAGAPGHAAGVDLEEFIACLVEVRESVTEKSIMKLEFKIKDLEEKMREDREANTERARQAEQFAREQMEQSRRMMQLLARNGAPTSDAVGNPAPGAVGNFGADAALSSADASRLERRMDQLEASTIRAFQELNLSCRIAQEEQARRQEEQARMLRQILSSTVECRSCRRPLSPSRSRNDESTSSSNAPLRPPSPLRPPLAAH